MSAISIALRRLHHVRCLSTTAATISRTKYKLQKTYDPDEALKVYTAFTSSADPISSSAFSTHYAQELTVRRLARSKRFDDVRNLLESLKSPDTVTSEPFVSSIIRSYGQAGMYQNAYDTYQQMTQFNTPRTSLSFNALLYALVRCKIYDEACNVFDELPAKYGFTPNEYSYAMLVNALCGMGKTDLAMEKLMGEFDRGSVSINAVSFTTILHSLYKNGKADEAEKFWGEMVNLKGLKPDVGSYNVRIGHVQRGNVEDLKALIDEMRAVGIEPDTITYNYLISCYCNNGMLDEAKCVYDEVLKMKGCRPNAATFRTMVFHLCKKGRFATAYKVFKRSVKDRKIPDFGTLKHLAEGLVKDGRLDDAKGLVRTMNKNFPPELLKAWGKLAGELGLIPVGDTERRDAGEDLKGVEPSETEKSSM